MSQYEEHRARFMRRLETVLDELESIGSEEMGHLPYRLAMRFHNATSRIRLLFEEMKQREKQP